jgi:hypothetical protein
MILLFTSLVAHISHHAHSLPCALNNTCQTRLSASTMPEGKKSSESSDETDANITILGFGSLFIGTIRANDFS